MKGAKKLRWTFDGGCIRCLSHFHDREGYPFLTRHGRRMKIGRHILFKGHGIQPDNIVSRHTCDNPWCINPDHILIGTHQDNYNDKIQRGRVPNGRRHWNSRLTDQQVNEILRSTKTHQAIADRFKISRTHVTNIKSGHRWAKETIRTIE